jgi:hypothetical protein
VWKKETRFHGELQKEVKQCVVIGQPHAVKFPTNEAREILNGRTY